jgi:hypothetical protein
MGFVDGLNRVLKKHSKHLTLFIFPLLSSAHVTSEMVDLRTVAGNVFEQLIYLHLSNFL